MKTVAQFLSLALVYSFSLHADDEQNCRRLDARIPDTILPALSACASWGTQASREEWFVFPIGFERAVADTKDACGKVKNVDWNCISMAAALQNLLAGKVVVRPVLKEPLPPQQAFVFKTQIPKGSQFCKGPSSWDDASKQQVLMLISEFSLKLPQFMKELETGDEPGKRTIELIKCESHGANGRYYDDDARKSGGNGRRILYIADHVFKADGDKNIRRYLGFGTLSFTFLHELAHAWDHAHSPQIASNTEEFQRKFGWVGNGQLQTFAMAQVQENLLTMGSLAEKARYLEAIVVTRDFGKAHGFPSSYSMVSPLEMLAEFVTWTYHDPKIKSYSNPKLVDYVLKNILR